MDAVPVRDFMARGGGAYSYCTRQAPGALLNGVRVTKANYEPGDAHRPGDLGTIVGSLGPADYKEHKNAYGYFIRWDDNPDLVVAVCSWRLKAVES
jgi:hypothetical protein